MRIHNSLHIETPDGSLTIEPTQTKKAPLLPSMRSTNVQKCHLAFDLPMWPLLTVGWGIITKKVQLPSNVWSVERYLSDIPQFMAFARKNWDTTPVRDDVYKTIEREALVRAKARLADGFQVITPFWGPEWLALLGAEPRGMLVWNSSPRREKDGNDGIRDTNHALVRTFARPLYAPIVWVDRTESLTRITYNGIRVAEVASCVPAEANPTPPTSPEPVNESSLPGADSPTELTTP